MVMQTRKSSWAQVSKISPAPGGARLAHNVEVDILRDGTQLFGRHRKVVGTHGHQRPVVAGAEVAVEVAEVGDLHIGALDVHGESPLVLIVVGQACLPALCYGNIVSHRGALE